VRRLSLRRWPVQTTRQRVDRRRHVAVRSSPSPKTRFSVAQPMKPKRGAGDADVKPSAYVSVFLTRQAQDLRTNVAEGDTEMIGKPHFSINPYRSLTDHS
jgi:hypothetical protein